MVRLSLQPVRVLRGVSGRVYVAESALLSQRRARLPCKGHALAAFLCVGAVLVMQLSKWTEQSPATSHQVRPGATMAFDGADGNVVLFGGADDNSVNGALDLLNDTCAWNGSIARFSALRLPQGHDGPFKIDVAPLQIALL